MHVVAALVYLCEWARLLVTRSFLYIIDVWLIALCFGALIRQGRVVLKSNLCTWRKSRSRHSTLLTVTNHQLAQWTNPATVCRWKLTSVWCRVQNRPHHRSSLGRHFHKREKGRGGFLPFRYVAKMASTEKWEVSSVRRQGTRSECTALFVP